MKPYICLFADTGKGFNVRNLFQYFAQSVCSEFDLNLNKVVWVEFFPQARTMDVATLKEGSLVGRERLYTVYWRSAHEHEIQWIRAHKFITNGLFA